MPGISFTRDRPVEAREPTQLRNVIKGNQTESGLACEPRRKQDSIAEE